MPPASRFPIPDAELEFRASRAGGPGGQHVNTSSTRVELRWNVAASTALSDSQRARLLEVLAGRLDDAGWLRVVAADTRSQFRNRELARERLEAMVARALVRRAVRKATKVPRAAKKKRLEAKRQRGALKAQRRRPERDD
ncbi:MAG: alternative ribosome rescue aminoacyl-tRNA hydrolase ArfB [Gemmatimonadales bacterium]